MNKDVYKKAGVGIRRCIVFALGIVLGARTINWLSLKQRSKDGINEGRYRTLGGQEQFVRFLGRNVTNPVILYLHGGPAAPDTYRTYAFARYLACDFTFISWDQRGSGRTYFKNRLQDPGNHSASFAQAVEDVDQLVDELRTRFHKKKVMIMGHSYGSSLGMAYVAAHPEKVSAYVGVAQVLSFKATDGYSFRKAYEKALRKGHDARPIKEAVHQFYAELSLDSLLHLRRLTANYHEHRIKDKSVWLTLTSPHFGLYDLLWLIKEAASFKKYYALNKKLFHASLSFHIKKVAIPEDVPLYFISGTDDWICPAKPIQDFVEGLSVQEKSFTAIKGCGHNVQYAAPRIFADAVCNLLRNVD